eukprot:CAMPEP_0174925088 /NCGR_PEP_ID=MMETSP1355-20121228/7680_1 /TAXON_ID=464990 /ORGANISM="Hemiselmis tepida, Strain CCMP443" /LENGTH=37 /DNA_ID= /DNA_START= /DNA_END= /DNA_ORIENTATION=
MSLVAVTMYWPVLLRPGGLRSLALAAGALVSGSRPCH